MRTEDEIVRHIEQVLCSPQLLRRSGIAIGPGDDAAVLNPPRGRDLVVSVDASFEGVHFPGGIHPPESVGYKSLARAASDLAAMGAQPLWFFLQIGFPMEKTGEWLDRLLRGMNRAARELNLVLAGGDTSCVPTVAISITVFGAVKRGMAIKRVLSRRTTPAGRRPMQLLFVSGRLGRAQLGLELLRRGARWETASGHLRRLLRPQMFPRIPMALSRWLAAEKIPSAMMDISDGLSTDLARLCAANGGGALLWQERIPRVKIPAALRGLGLDSLRLALHGGEDYALLFTVPEQRRHLLFCSHWAKHVTEIGFLMDKPGIYFSGDPNKHKPLEPEGWDPFAAPDEPGESDSE